MPISYRFHTGCMPFPHPGIIPPVSHRFHTPVSYPVSYPRFHTGFIMYGRRLRFHTLNNY
eukprot:5813770-Heterocapsa_arctica.AAC.1